MSDDQKPDIDIQAEANQCHQWWLDQGTRAGPYHEAWQGWSARASLAAEREREMVDMLLEAQREGCTRCCYPHSAQCLRITAALKKGPSDDQRRA